MRGGGSFTLTMTQAENTTQGWGGLFPTDLENNTDARQVLESSFFTWQPTLTLEYEIHPFVILELTGGWLGGTADEWELNEHFTVEGMPDLDLNGGFARIGLTFGLFLGEN